MINSNITNLVPVDQLFKHFSAFIESARLKWNDEFIAYIIQFMSEHTGTLINIPGNYAHSFDWDYMEQVLIQKLGENYLAYFNRHIYTALHDQKNNIYYFGYDNERSATVGQQYLRLVSLGERVYHCKQNKIS